MRRVVLPVQRHLGDEAQRIFLYASVHQLPLLREVAQHLAQRPEPISFSRFAIGALKLRLDAERRAALVDNLDV